MAGNNNRQINKDLKHMKEHLEAAKMHINFVENCLLASIERERKRKRKDDG